jgi:hypothetical protein
LNLSVVIRALRAEVGGWGLRGLVRQALVLLVYRRLGAICGDMERLCLRFQAGSLWRVVGRAVVARRIEGEGRRAAAARVWPGRFGWLVWAVGYQAAGFGSQLQAVLSEPEMVALLTATPRAGRILRPLCRMLAVDIALLRPRPAVVEVAPDDVGVVAKTRVRKPRVPVDFGRIPLPRGVLLAARRQGFGKRV